MLLNLVINSHGYSTVFVVVKGTVNRNLNFSVFVIVIIGVARNLCLGKWGTIGTKIDWEAEGVKGERYGEGCLPSQPTREPGGAS